MKLPIRSIEFFEDYVRDLKLRWGLEARPLWEVFDSFQPGYAVKWIDRLAPFESIAVEWALAQAYEQALGLAVPERAVGLRMIHLEVQRLVWCFDYIHRVLFALGDRMRTEQALYLRELALGIMEMLTGARILPQFLCLGGVDRDLTAGESRKLRESTLHIEAEIRYSFSEVDHDQLICQGLENVLPLRPEKIVNLNWGGVLAQAGGIAMDARLTRRFGFYTQYDLQFFENPMGTVEGRLGADALTRFRAVLFQIRQSLALIPKFLLQLADGPVRTDNVEISSTLQVSKQDLSDGFFFGVCEGGAGPIYAALVQGKARLTTSSMRLAPHLESLLRGVHRDDLQVAVASLGFDYAQGELGFLPKKSRPLESRSENQPGSQIPAQTDQQSNAQTDKQANGQTDQQLNGQTDKRSNGQTDQQLNGQTDKRSNGQTDKQANGQTDKQSNSQTAQRVDQT